MTEELLQQTLDFLLEESVEAATIRERSTFDSLAAPYENRVVLYGAGGLGRNAMNALRVNGFEPLAFCDGNPVKWGTEISGVPVMSPEDASRRYGRDAAFVITISARGGDFLPLAQKFSDLGCVKVIPFRCLFWKYPAQCPAHLFHDIPSRILAHKADIEKAYRLLSDTASRVEFLAQLRWRLHQDFEALTIPWAGEQYFPDEIFTTSTEEVFVDAGAFDGDTLRVFLGRQPQFREYIALEPDPDNFVSLTNFVESLSSPTRGRITPLMKCLGERKEKIRFSTGAGEASQISDEGDVEVDCETLDEIMSDTSPTFVKMDIEGAEPSALKGSKRLLSEGRAIWAICVYHQPEHLWEIPLLIAGHSKDYRFFLRKYVGEIWETVCYAVPVHRL